MNATAGAGKHVFWWSVAAWSVVHILCAVILPLSGDEAYYWDCARHLDWAYYDQPGLMIWPIALTRLVFGDSSLAVRAPALLAGFALAPLLLGLIRRFGGGYREATAAYAVLHLMPLFFLGSFYESTDIGLAAAYLAATWAAVSIAQGDRRGWWGFGLAAGVGFLAKFSIVTILPVVGVVLMAKSARDDLRTPTPWLAALVSILLTTPVWIWAALNGGDNLFFQGMRRAEQNQLTSKYLVEFAGSSLALATPFLGLAAGYALLLFVRRKQVGHRVVAAAALMPFLVFGAVSLTNRVGAHWGGPGMVVGAAVLALVPFRWRKALIILGAIFGLTVSAVILGIVLFPEPLMRVEWSYAGRPKRFNTRELSRLVGTESMTAEFERRRIPGEPMLFTSYTDTHLFNFLSEGRLDLRLANLSRGKHGLASLYWYPRCDLIGRDILVVTPKNRLAKLLPTYCTEVEELDPVEVRWDGRVIRKLLVLRCREVRRDPGAFTR